jgi:sugar transferase (PEP-CTERM/EpsH1 system associated)
LLKNHEIALGFTFTPGDASPDMEWARKFMSVYCGRISTLDRLARVGIAALTGLPLSVAAFRHDGLARWVRQYVAEKRPDLIFAFSSAMAQYAPPDARLILDFVDADSEKWRQYGEVQPATRAWFYRMEAQRLLKFDRAQAARAQASLFVSDDERRVFDRLSPQTQARHAGIANGVDTAYFDPSKVTARSSEAPTIVFVGVMDYWPNIDAVSWFAGEILPLVRMRHADARFQIVGARPVAGVRALSRMPGVEVTGGVDDVRPYVAAAAVVVAPLRVARGIQNKVLEGMAMARPVVTTTGALEGINAEPGRDLLTGDTAGEIAEAVSRVLEGRAPQGLGDAARAYVLKRHEWSANLRRLDELIAQALAAP